METWIPVCVFMWKEKCPFVELYLFAFKSPSSNTRLARRRARTRTLVGWVAGPPTLTSFCATRPACRPLPSSCARSSATRTSSSGVRASGTGGWRRDQRGWGWPRILSGTELDSQLLTQQLPGTFCSLVLRSQSVFDRLWFFFFTGSSSYTMYRLLIKKNFFYNILLSLIEKNHLILSICFLNSL